MAEAQERLSVLQRARWWLADYLYAGWRQAAFLRPPWGIGGHRPTPAAWRRGDVDLPEIVLLPGVYEHWTFLRPLGDALNQAGHRVRVVHGLGTNRRAVVATSERLGRALSRRGAPDAGRVLVAHSKGGLIGKHLLVASGAANAAAVEAAAGGDAAEAAASAPAPDDRTDAATDAPRPLGLLGLVAVCTPFHGSRLAGLFLVPSIRAFRPDDETIVSLGREESINGRIVSIFGRFDPHIPGGSALEGATNVLVPGNGHFRVLGDPKTHAAVIDGVRLLSDPGPLSPR
ncbi:MAG: hypothetical protein ABWY37_00800 [Microbacterium pygmaeum]